MQNKYFSTCHCHPTRFLCILLANLISGIKYVKKENNPLGSSISPECSKIKLILVVIFHCSSVQVRKIILILNIVSFTLKVQKHFQVIKKCLASYITSRLHHLHHIEMIKWNHHSLQPCHKCLLQWCCQATWNKVSQSPCTQHFRVLFCGYLLPSPKLLLLVVLTKTGIKADPWSAGQQYFSLIYVRNWNVGYIFIPEYQSNKHLRKKQNIFCSYCLFFFHHFFFSVKLYLWFAHENLPIELIMYLLK